MSRTTTWIFFITKTGTSSRKCILIVEFFKHTNLTFLFSINIHLHFNSRLRLPMSSNFLNPSAFLFCSLFLSVHFNSFYQEYPNSLRCLYFFPFFLWLFNPQVTISIWSPNPWQGNLHSVREYNPTLRLLLFEANELQL